jgi:predicted anti-sigma-YlaC factor YlaD
MSCDKIREQLLDLVYDEEGVPPAGSEVRDHLRTCAVCREEVEELKRTRKYLQLWKDEPPLRSVLIAKHEKIAVKNAARRYLRYAAVAAMVFIALLALANTRVSWDKNGFAFSTHLFTRPGVEGDYITKAELRDLMKKQDASTRAELRDFMKEQDASTRAELRDFMKNRDYYTKAESRDLMKEALDYTNETNYLMMQRMLDSIEQDRWSDIRLVRDQIAENNK